VLVVDDEGHIVELATLYLQNEGYRVISAATGAEALQQVEREQPSLVVLDLMLPEVDGWDVCRQIRAKGALPIIMLTARSDDVDKIVGLELGADDYLTKPFNPRELVARVKAVLRRADVASTGPDLVRAGPLTIDAARRESHLGGRPLSLRAKEFDLLWVLAEHQGLVLTRDQLLEQVWGFDYGGQTRTVDVHVAHVRQHLGDGPVVIETVWGIGYNLVAE
jgi:two-component system alkaline phosphatase synthesis response regulator PhoP